MTLRIAIVASILCAASLLAQSTLPSTQPLRPDLKFPTLESYQAEIHEPGILLQSDHVWMFAPKGKQKEAQIIFPYLTKAYDQLFSIVGQHTKYKIVVYHLPKGWGGTGDCVIEYDYSNLDLAKQEEWTKYKVPHVSGYIEEMAHNFVGTTHVQFGWEMVGWTLGVKATQKVAPNPIFAKQVSDTRQGQSQTLARYRAAGYVFPKDLEANQCDRIHAYLLYLCEQRYGPKFWPDFFAEVLKDQEKLNNAVNLPEAQIRDERYRITVDCFDRLPKLNFKKMLESNHISTTVDVKSLHPTEPAWDRRLEPAK